MFTLKGFQRRAIEESVTRINQLKNQPRSNVRLMMLNAGCGGGKTVMLGGILTQTTGDDLTIVVTPGAGSLAEQTHAALRRFIPKERKVVHVQQPTDIDGAEPGTVYVTNYEKLVVKHSRDQKDGKGGQYKSAITRKGETFNWWDMLTSAKDRGIDVVVAVDEAHYGSRTSTGAIQKFFREMSEHLGYEPLRIETTATPNRRAASNDISQKEVVIDRQDLIDCGLTREEIVLNSEYARSGLTGDDEDAVLMELMFAKWARARQVAHENNLHTPLMTFCISNDNKGGIQERDKVITFLADKRDPVTGLPLTTDNGTVAVHLTDERMNVGAMGEIASKDSPVVAMIFKQAIALGWDCPRAQFMMITRSIISTSFTTQLLGRILRQPTGSATGIPLMDSAYVYAAIDRAFEVPSDLRGVLAEDTTRQEVMADAAQLALWKDAGLRMRRAARTQRAGAWEASAVYPLIKDIKVVPENSPFEVKAMHAGDATVHQDGRIDESELFQGVAYEHNAQNQFIVELGERMRTRGITAAVRGAEYCQTGLEKWAESQDHEWFQEAPWRTIVANKALMEPVITALVDGAAAYMRGKDKWMAKEWETFTPASSRFIAYEATFTRDVKGHKYYEGAMKDKHLYGSPAAHKTTSAEVNFENDVIRGDLLGDFSGTIVSWFRNETGFTSDSGEIAANSVFSLTYKTGETFELKGQTHEVSRTMEPDYLVMVKRPDGSHKVWIFEVKGEGFRDGSGDDSRFLKARALRDHNENGASGAAVYRKDGVWMVVQGEMRGGSVLDEMPLTEWIARQS